jgi:hypothetical protein
VNLKTLCKAAPELAKNRCPELLPKAEFLEKTFMKIFTLFGKCHAVYDTAKPLSASEISQLG